MDFLAANREPRENQMSNRRYRLILGAILRDGRWSGTVRGRRIEIERYVAEDGRTTWVEPGRSARLFDWNSQRVILSGSEGSTANV